MTTPELNQTLLAALKALVDEVQKHTYPKNMTRVSGYISGAACSITTFNNAKAVIEAAEKELQ